MPPRGVREQTARPVEREDPTPIGAPPEEARAKVGDILAAKAELIARIDAHATDDIKALGTVTSSLERLHTRTSVQDVKLDALVTEANLSQEKRIKLELAKAEAEIDDKTDARKKGREVKTKLLTVLLGIAGAALTVAITHYAEHC